MSASFPATWQRGGIPRTAVAPSSGPRHLAPEGTTATETSATEVETARKGRHAEPEWGREVFDPARDEDPFDWLGFTPEPD